MYFNKKSIMASFMAVLLMAPAIYAAPGENKPKTWFGLTPTQIAVPAMFGIFRGWFVTEPRIYRQCQNSMQGYAVFYESNRGIHSLSRRAFDWTIRDDHRALERLRSTPTQLDVIIEDSEQRQDISEKLHEIREKQITGSNIELAAGQATILGRLLYFYFIVS